MKMATKINHAFAETLDEAFKKKFRTRLETSYNIFAMRLVSRRKDGKKLTRKQHTWIGTYSLGYQGAMAIAENAK